ncbi:MAG: PEP/pyruvate-binding domain-containing protein [Bryobacteraceae bacterium]
MIVIQLSQATSAMLPLVGGKAANLGEMIRAQLPVPGGFCVTTHAYAQVAKEHSFIPSEARQSILAAPMPDAIRSEIIRNYEALGPNIPVAVRSSATAEDLPNASFAGQQDTYLNVIGAGNVVDAVQRCWASLWTDRAVVYRNTNNIDHATVRLAVVVQQMVEAKVAGVLFTANPVTGKRRQAVIDASPGLGEAIVSGAVNPDHFTVDTTNGTILERRIGDKRFAVESVAGGGTRHVDRGADSDEACITDTQVRALAVLGNRVERFFGSPQDTEWAIDATGALWLTQARPITTLFPIPHGPASRNDDFAVYFCFSVAQGLYRPITPMGRSAARLIASSAAKILGIPVDNPLEGPPVYAESAQRIFVNLTGTLRGRMGRWIMPRMLDVMEARSAAKLRALFDKPELSVNRHTPFLFFSRILRLAARYAIPVRIAEAIRNPENAHRSASNLAAKVTSKLSLPPTASPIERLDFVERMLSDEVIGMVPGIMPSAVAGFAMLAIAAKLLGKDATPADLESVLRGLPHNITTEMDLSLWRLAQQIGTDKEAAHLFRESTPSDLHAKYMANQLPAAAQEGVREFLAQYGHRAVAEIDLGLPRWSDDPTHILGVLANYLRLEDQSHAPDAMFAQGAEEAERTIASLTARARRRGTLRGKLVNFALNRVRQLAGIRELPKYYMVVVLAAARRELALIGETLAAKEAIHQPDDIFFLHLPEVRRALNGENQKATVTRRKEDYDMELRRRQVPSVILSDGTEPVLSQRQATAGELEGTPASTGEITGIARVILDPVGAHLEPGEILVAPSTDPGWTPLFLTAGGLVMEMGGANSHGAVVAREYGIPAVVGVPDATLRITTGNRIRINGATGQVTFA